MIPLLNSHQMRALDDYTIHKQGVSAKKLMEQAGKAVYQELLSILKKRKIKKVIVICGKGNNGGDGRVVARLLIKLKKIKVRVWDADKSGDLISDKQTLILDAIFGTGLSRPIKGLEASLIKILNKMPGYKVALDIPSGLNATTGEVMGVAFKADTTISFEYPKTGFYFLKAHEYVGELVVKRIGLASIGEAKIETDNYLIDSHDVEPFVAKRVRDVHKGDMGRVFVVAGSTNKMGASSMTSLAALAAGAGLSTLVLPKAAFKKIDPLSLEIMYEPVLDAGKGVFILSSLKPVFKALENARVAVLGPGMGVEPETIRFVSSFVSGYKGPLLVDADGLNALALNTGSLKKRRGLLTILTPHPAEMARLIKKTTSYVQCNRLKVSRNFAVANGVILLLKGFRTLSAYPDGRVFINTTGSPSMATAGQGDVLSGLIAGILSEHQLNPMGVCAGVYCHGIAGEWIAAGKKRVALASCVIEEFQKVYNDEGIKRNNPFG